MTPKEIKAFFPIEIEITDTHRQFAIRQGGLHYLGGILLKSYIPDELHEDIFWGLSIGTIKGVQIKTEYKEMFKGKLTGFPLYLDSRFTRNKVKFELR